MCIRDRGNTLTLLNGGLVPHLPEHQQSAQHCKNRVEDNHIAHAHLVIHITGKANVAEIAATYQAAYPNARILYASEKDFSNANRVRFFNNIKNNDYDCVIMSVSYTHLDVYKRQGSSITEGKTKPKPLHTEAALLSARCV